MNYGSSALPPHERDFTPSDVARAMRAARLSAHRIVFLMALISTSIIGAGSNATVSSSAFAIADVRHGQ